MASSPSASKDVERAMHKFKRGNLKSGKGGKGGTVKVASKPLQSGLRKKVPTKKASWVCPASQHQVREIDRGILG